MNQPKPHIKETAYNLMNWFRFQYRLVIVGVKRRKPIFVGIGSTKLFLSCIAVLAILPQRDNDEWSWRIISFLLSPSNEIGDTFAGIAGALAFLWIIVTVMLQSSELAEQRKEISRQADEFEKMNETMQIQKFEAFFFELISTQNSIVNSMDLRKSNEGTVISQGRDCFENFYRKIVRHDDRWITGEKDIQDNAMENYATLIEDSASDLGQYFRFTYNALREIHESEYSTIRHRRLFRSLFSDDELLVIFYNCLSPSGEKLIAYMEIFEFFDNLPKDRLVRQAHWTQYQDLVGATP